MSDELKSRYQELYPPHTCSACGLEHTSIPHIHATTEVEGEEVHVPFMPFELVSVVEGSTRPGRQEENMDTPAHIYGLFWGPPGAERPIHQSILFMN